MSGGAEANFTLGWDVNVDAHVNLLKTTYAHAKSTGVKPNYVYASSLAVYGGPKCTPQSFVIPKWVHLFSSGVGAGAHGTCIPDVSPP
jgi:hypothetical protein